MPDGRWDESVIGQTLLAVAEAEELATHEPLRMPTMVTLRAQGFRNLERAIAETGGPARWARKLGLQLRPGQDRGEWTEDDVLARALRVRNRYGRLPEVRALRALGETRLAARIERAGGLRAFCERHGLDTADIGRRLPTGLQGVRDRVG